MGVGEAATWRFHGNAPHPGFPGQGGGGVAENLREHYDSFQICCLA